MRRIASRQNPVVARYRAAARGDAEGLMLLDGVHLVEEALAAGTRIREAAMSVEHASDARGIRLAAALERGGADVVSATAPVMAALSPVRSTSPVVALADRPDRDPRVFDATATPCVIV